MNLDTARCYQALLTHDARFDGVFFVGVSTTRIYCRTICTACACRDDLALEPGGDVEAPPAVAGPEFRRMMCRGAIHRALSNPRPFQSSRPYTL